MRRPKLLTPNALSPVIRQRLLALAGPPSSLSTRYVPSHTCCTPAGPAPLRAPPPRLSPPFLIAAFPLSRRPGRPGRRRCGAAGSSSHHPWEIDHDPSLRAHARRESRGGCGRQARHSSLPFAPPPPPHPHPSRNCCQCCPAAHASPHGTRACIGRPSGERNPRNCCPRRTQCAMPPSLHDCQCAMPPFKIVNVQCNPSRLSTRLSMSMRAYDADTWGTSSTPP